MCVKIVLSLSRICPDQPSTTRDGLSLEGLPILHLFPPKLVQNESKDIQNAPKLTENDQKCLQNDYILAQNDKNFSKTTQKCQK